MQVAHQPRALARQRRGARALLLPGKAGLQLVLGLAHQGDHAAGKAVDLVQRAGEPPGQPGADRDQHRRIGQPREKNIAGWASCRNTESMSSDPAGQHDGDRAAEHEADGVLPLPGPHGRRSPPARPETRPTVGAPTAERAWRHSGLDRRTARPRRPRRPGRKSSQPYVAISSPKNSSAKVSTEGAFQRRRGNQDRVQPGVAATPASASAEKACTDADRHRRGEHAIGRLVAPHHPHDAEDDREDRLPGRKHHRQASRTAASALVIARPQHRVGADIDAIEKAGDRSPDEQPDRRGRWRRRAAARPGSPRSRA